MLSTSGKMIAPVVEEYAQAFPDVKFYKVDIDNNAIARSVAAADVSAVVYSLLPRFQDLTHLTKFELYCPINWNLHVDAMYLVSGISILDPKPYKCHGELDVCYGNYTSRGDPVLGSILWKLLNNRRYNLVLSKFSTPSVRLISSDCQHTQSQK